ncbi:phosphorylase family protein [Litoreibacter roseus]|uniref:5'-methylthioadenosine/S-adenosylhomocysteine nucleosidase n=1 Tax=Litoreibacter roseus TaxID=2601869 RepID=A0A6N6JL07_9RHOB|nr:HD domain-containing protein [Litoreibacter roseus]GFE67001.1 hypothetical protein KIN_40750 [Litoreibacter roseus]
MTGVDVVILVALSEEFDTFQKYDFYELGEKEELGPFSQYRFSFFDKHNVSRNGVVVLVNDMGSKIRDATIEACRQHGPRIVINAGISGRLNTDAKLGDLVIPSHINLYAERGAAVQSGKGYVLQAGGSAIPIERELRNSISEPQFLSKVGFPTFLDFCSIHGFHLTESDIEKTKAWITEGEVSQSPNAVVGPFAVGPLVGKAESFKLFLKGTDKNVLAIDMESGYVGDAIENMNRRTRPDFIAIRSVSDTGDQRKKEFDAVGSGAFRQWAMNNIVSILQKFIEHQYEFQDTKEAPSAKQDPPQSLEPSTEQLNLSSSHYADGYPGQNIDRSSLSDAKNSRFSNLRKKNNADQAPVTYEELIEELRSAPNGSLFLVEGAGGCGKSSMLRFVEDELNIADDAHKSIYINSRIVFEQMPERQADIAILDFFEKALQSYKDSDARLIVLFDELFGHPREEPIVEALLSVLDRMNGKAVLAFGFDHYETSKSKNGDKDGLYLYKKRYEAEFRLKNTNIFDRSKALPVIRGMLETGQDLDQSTTAEDIYGIALKLGFPYLNAFVVSLLLENRGKRLFEQSRSSTEFILHAMRDELKRREEKVKSGISFDDICVEALRVHIPELRRKGVSKDREWHRDYFDDNFAQFPKLVQTSFIANAVAHLMEFPPDGSHQLFKSLEIDHEDFYSIVFGCDVTSSIKDLLHNEELEERLLRSAVSICDKLKGPSLSFALYLAGRAVSPNGKSIAKDIFKLTDFLLENDLSETSAKDVRTISAVSNEDKFLRLATRTHFISAAYSGDADLTSEYIRRVINDPVEESLNRTFHLEYYGDHPARSFGSASISVRLELDETSEAWKRTRGVLQHRIRAAITQKTFSQVHKIHILTYFCILKSKHEQGLLSEWEVSEASEILQQLKNFLIDIGEQLTGFLHVLEHALQFDRYDLVDVIENLYKIKTIPRFGWVSRGFGTEVEGVETVGSHVLGSLILADILLPDLYPHMTLQEHYRVKDLLLTHDIGEAFVGDFHPSDQTKREEEKHAIALIDAMRVYGDYSNLRTFGERFEDFSEGTSQEARLAVAFDKLDAIFQALFYKEKFESTDEFQHFLSENFSRISDVKVRRFAQTILARAGVE